MTEIKERLVKFLKSKELGQKRFETEVGLSNGSVNKLTYPTSETLRKIVGRYPDLSLVWLVLGKGDMLAGNDPSPADVSTLKRENEELRKERDGLQELCNRQKVAIAALNGDFNPALRLKGKERRVAS